ncbi:MAG: cytochrome c biogenesis protein ResB, partial [Bacteroidota bacterium]|nr:cytochrome c biogenesis protein ResB [Bacteroidota bacterium]
MKKIFEFLFSMPWMAFLILVMIFSTAMATFIENDFGPAAARAVVYNAWWFEVLLALIVFNLLGNMIKGKVYKKKKLSIFIFHFAFFFIFFGAAITRYISYEGTMHIRENNSSDRIISSGSYLYAAMDDNSEQASFYKKTNFISGKKNKFSGKLKVGNENLKLKLLQYIPNAEKSLVPDPFGESILSLVSLGPTGRQSHLLKAEETAQISKLQIGFNKNTTNFNIISKEEGLYFICKNDVSIMDMASNTQDTLKAGELHPFQTRRLYTIESIQLVLTDYLRKGKVEWKIGPNDGLVRSDAIVLEASYKSKTETITCFGRSDRIGRQYNYNLDGARLTLGYGPRSIQLPFTLFLKDFQLEKYPGSNSPASYASEVTLIDSNSGLEKDNRIFMNNILDYKGYRFFQSSYDTDEKGTILSVNHDVLGTAVTYIGYFLMTLGMLLSLFNKNSRFRSLARSESEKKNKNPAVALILLIAFTTIFPTFLNAQQETGNEISTSQAAELASILVQDQGGRIKPLQSMTSDIVRKVAKNESVMGL